MAIIGKPKFLRRIKDMEVGERGFIVPWALQFDCDGFAYLELAHSISCTPRGTISLEIKRIGKEKNGYDIFLENTLEWVGPHKYSEKRDYSWEQLPREKILCGGEDIVELDYNINNPSDENERDTSLKNLFN